MADYFWKCTALRKYWLYSKESTCISFSNLSIIATHYISTYLPCFEWSHHILLLLLTSSTTRKTTLLSVLTTITVQEYTCISQVISTIPISTLCTYLMQPITYLYRKIIALFLHRYKLTKGHSFSKKSIYFTFFVP